VSAGIVNAVLIGDRTGLPDDVTERLQAAGTYHVIAISGGNVAILTGLVLGLVSLAGLRGRSGSALTAGAIVAYASVVTAGPSVWRATSMAATYLAARALDLRAHPWQAVALAAGATAVLQPLDVSGVGYTLTFGATLALLQAVRASAAIGAAFATRRHPVEGAGSGGGIMRQAVIWVAVALVSTAAVEVTLLPVAAYVFSRVTIAGVLLNLVAIPAMAVVEVAGLLVVLLPWASAVAGPAGWIAHAGAAALVGSARLVEVAPWLTTRVAPPSLALLACYYLALAGTLASRSVIARVGSVALLAVATVCIVAGVPPQSSVVPPATGSLRWTIFDVGQGDGMLLEFPGRRRLIVDAGGAPFGARGFDLGARVLAPAVWARGIRSLDAVLLTHGDPDHAGGAQALLESFDVGALWDGVDVPEVPLLEDVGQVARRVGIPRHSLRAGDAWTWGGVHVRVLHPPAPDWQRVRVRNDDSVVLELGFGGVAVLLAGDVSAEVERVIAGKLTPARLRVLKVAHHGSRSSTSEALLDAWRPHAAIISCGRGNTFGHPAPDVVRRLEQRGIGIWRTDRDGQVTVDTDGRTLSIASYVGRRVTVLSGR
jgi:competence protein ComEC